MGAVRDVLIVGGGIAGMTLAMGLSRHGIKSEIVELSTDWTVIGVGISMQGPALRALRTVGVLDKIIDNGFGYSHFKACDVDGNVTGQVDLPSLNGPNYPATMGVMRQALHEVLKVGVTEAQAPVRLGISVVACHQGGDGIRVEFTDRTEGNYDLVVGADGANSKMRKLLFGDAREGRYTGQAVWRATVDRPPEVDCRHSYFGPRNKAGFNPVSKDLMYIYLVQNLPKWKRLDDDMLPGTMREQLSDFGGILAASREQVQDPQSIVYRPINSLLLPAPWYKGQMLLIGDAAHTATPHMAAGAGLAIEDSVVLAELLGSGSEVSEVLEKFMARRWERCRMTIKNSEQLGEWEKTPDLPEADPVGLFGKSVKILAQPI